PDRSASSPIFISITSLTLDPTPDPTVAVTATTPPTEEPDMTDQSTPPIVCDMTDAPDTSVERVAEYSQLFADALIGREQTPDGANRCRFRADRGIEDRVRSLAAKEQACCAFFDFTVTTHGAEVWWDATTVDDPIAQRILDELYRLPDTVGDGVEAHFDRFEAQGLTVVTNDDGVMRPATPEELGIANAP